MAAHPTVKSLKKEITDLQKKIGEMNWRKNETKTVYVQRERTIPKFIGYNMDIEDWIEEVQYAARGTTAEQGADLIYQHLTGNARDEIKYLDGNVRQEPLQMIRILREAFGDKENAMKLQKKFLDRKQLESETLRQYSYALMDIMKRLLRKDPSVFANEDKAISGQFSENVKDVFLRKHLKRILRTQPNITFMELREEAILWAEEEENSDVNSKEKQLEKSSTTRVSTIQSESESESRIKELSDILKKQSRQIDSLTKAVNSAQRYEPDWYYKQPLICFGCKKEGHKIADCPSKPESTNADSNRQSTKSPQENNNPS